MDGLKMVRRLGGGHFFGEPHAAMLRVSEEVVATGKPGKVSVSLKVTKPRNSAEPIVIIEGEVGVNFPKAESQGAFLFIRDGEFHAKDPRQTEMELRVKLAVANE